MKITDQRKERLLNKLSQLGNMTVEDVAKEFGTSMATARRLCSDLSNEGKAFRLHGGIRYLPQIDTKYDPDAAKYVRYSEKLAIAQYAATMLSNDQTVFLESGSTIFECALAISERMRRGELSCSGVFTCSLVNLNVLAPVCDTTLIGGKFRAEQQDFRGYLSERTVSFLSFDYTFIGADAITLDKGIMVWDVDSVRFLEIVLPRTAHAIILADSSKFERNSLISLMPAQKASAILTDKGLSDEVYNKFVNAGINLLRL